jgi:hypothetical protein
MAGTKMTSDPKTQLAAPMHRVLLTARKLAGRISSGLLFLVIPVVFLIAVSVLTKAKGPQWLPFTFENPYKYLFNSLLLVKGQAPFSIDHPGTTTEVLGAIVLRASSLASNQDLIVTVLLHPEHYIQVLHWSLLIFTVLVLWLAPWLTAEVLSDRVIGILIQAPSLFFSVLFFYGILFGPDLMLVPFSIAAICCCTLLVIPSRSVDLAFVLGIGDQSAGSAASGSIRVPLIAAVTGLVCALGIVTKLTFFPLILISLLCCRTRKNLLAFIISFVVGVAIALLPIYSQLPRLVTWMFNLGIHSGRYDTGDVGLPPTGVYLSSLLGLIHSEPLVVIIPVAATTVTMALSLISRRPSQTNRIGWRTALALLVVQAFSLVAVAKEQGLQYLIPLGLTTGLSLVFLFQACTTLNQAPLKKAVARIALVGLIALGLKSFLEETPETYADLHQQKLDQLRLYQHAREISTNDVRVDYFFSDSPVFPLFYGNNWAGGAFGSLLLSLYPDKLFLNVYNGQFETFTEWISPDTILNKYDHLYFLGNPTFLPKLNGFEPDKFETIDRAGNYCLQKWTRR